MCAALIAGLMVGYKFNMGNFLAREMRDFTAGKEKLLLVYTYLITQLYLVVGMQELLY